MHISLVGLYVAQRGVFKLLSLIENKVYFNNRNNTNKNNIIKLI